MLKKIITIVYTPNGDFQNIVSKEIMFNRLTDELVKEGRTILTATWDTVKFDDGSIIQTMSFSKNSRGRRSTHIVIDKSILKIQGSDKLIDAVLKPMLIKNGSDTYELTGDRISTYSMENGEIKKEKF